MSSSMSSSWTSSSLSCPSSLCSSLSSLTSRLSTHLVLYTCPCCNSMDVLSRLYLCRHCLDLRCGYCVSHEVDSHYCPNCLENVPSGEARSKRNTCTACFECPVCTHALSTRATTMNSSEKSNADTPNNASSKKVYYLACASCRWSSRDAGLAERHVATGAWPEFIEMVRECHGDTAQLVDANETRLATLQSHYRQMAQREKAERENRKYVLGSTSKKLSYLRISERYGLLNRRPNSASMLMARNSNSTSFDADAEQNVEPAVAKKIEEVEVMDEHVFDQEVDLCAVTTIAQRLTHLQLQPEHASQLVPKHTKLIVRRSQRCRSCEHNLSKPEYNPSSIKFKIQLSAYYHVPRIILGYNNNESEVEVGSRVEVVIKVTNPSQHATRVRFRPLKAFDEYRERRKRNEEEDDKDEDDNNNVDSVNNNLSSLSLGSTSAAKKLLMRQTLHVLPRESDLKLKNNASLLFDDQEEEKLDIGIPNRDDTAEFDEDNGQIRADDDPECVLYRKYNVVALKLKCRIDHDLCLENHTKDVVLGFAMEFDYTNMLVSVEKQRRETNVVPIMVPVYIKLPFKLKI